MSSRNSGSSPAVDSSHPDMLGRYRIERVLGRGGMGVVYLAHDHSPMNRQVALKVPTIDPSNSDAGREFLVEVQAVAKLNHPGICQIFDYCDQPQPFMVMPFLTGPTLQEYLAARTTPLTNKETAEISRAVAEALQHAHQRKIVHRDLKPSNIIFHEGKPLVTDFGLAKRLDVQGTLSQPGCTKGTLTYMSPEQAQQALGNRSEIRESTDIFSLGVLIYEMLTLQIPFLPKDPNFGHLPFEFQRQQILQSIVSQTPDPPRRLREDVMPFLEGICLQMMRKEILSRPSTMQEVVDVLGQALEVLSRPIRRRKDPEVGASPPTGTRPVEPTGDGAPKDSPSRESDSDSQDQNEPSASDSGGSTREEHSLREAPSPEMRSESHSAMSSSDTDRGSSELEDSKKVPSSDLANQAVDESPVVVDEERPEDLVRPLPTSRPTLPPFRNRRLFESLRVTEGRSQIVLSGEVEDYFAIDLIQGVQTLDDAISCYARERDFDCVLFLNQDRELRFLTPEMERTFNAVVRRDSQDPQRRGQAARAFVPQRRRPENTPPNPPQGATSAGSTLPSSSSEGSERSSAAAQQVTVAAVSALQARLDQVSRMLKAPLRTLIVVHNPEMLLPLEPTAADLKLFRTMIAWGALVRGHPETCTVLVVDPGRLQRFYEIAKMCPVEQEKTRREIQLARAGIPELQCAIERLLSRRSLVGNAGRLAAEAHAHEWSVRNVGERIREILWEDPDLRSLDQLDPSGNCGQSLDDLLARMNGMIGLSSVKEHVHELVTVSQNLVAQATEDSPQAHHHYFFLGNPGSGKTVIAELFGMLLFALGIRTSGKFVNVSISELTSSNVGETTERLRAAFQSAMGGVLFIDEVYLLAESQEGRRALQSLLVPMEQHAQSVTVIMAMYPERLQEFLNVNSGFKSRVPYTLRFEDYTSREMLAIFQKLAAENALTIDRDGCSKLMRTFDWFNQRGGMENGRGVRNLFEKSYSRFLQRHAMNQPRVITAEMIPDPPQFRDAEAIRLLEAFDTEFLGLPRVKDYLRNLYNRQQTNALQGRKSTGNNNALFLGNPGTGKTSIVRRMSRIYWAMGILSEENHVISTGKGDLTADQHQSAPEKLREKFDEARGGILFIDEAYELTTDSEGTQIINELVRLSLLPRYGNLVIIMAGYHDPMQEVLKINSGLGSRFPNQLHFDDFTPDELVEIFEQRMRSDPILVSGVRQPRRISPADQANFSSRLRARLSRMSLRRQFGNARDVSTFYEEVVARQGARCREDASAVITDFCAVDLTDDRQLEESVEDILQDLGRNFIGLNNVKRQIQDLAERLTLERELERRNLTKTAIPYYNMQFVGNPGTGKTEIARYMGRVFAALGVIDCGRNFLECRGLDLLGQYQGQTIDKVNNFFANHPQHVILIDEAYALNPGASGRAQGSFQQEAIDALVGNMSDPRNRSIVLIFAGYGQEMQTFFTTNQGLSSRVPFLVQFDDYSAQECLQILNLMAAQQGFRIDSDPEIEDLLLKHFTYLKLLDNFGNGRTVSCEWGRLKLIFQQRVGARLSQAELVITFEDIETLTATGSSPV